MRHLLWLFLLVIPLCAQPSSTTARHVIAGATLPATCSPNTGDVYFRVTAGPVGGLYQCTAVNAWTAVPTSGGGASPAGKEGSIQAKNGSLFSGNANAFQLGDLDIVRTSSTVLTVAGNCTVTSPCVYWAGNTYGPDGYFDGSNVATVTVAPGFGAGANAIIVAGYGSSALIQDDIAILVYGFADISKITCNAFCRIIDVSSNQSVVYIPLGRWQTTVDGVWDSTSSSAGAPFIKSVYTENGIVIGYNTPIEDGNSALYGRFLRINPSSTITWTPTNDGNTITMVANLATAAPISGATYSTATNCADSAGAAACGSAAAGRFVADAAATSVVVSTTAVTANSEIFIEYDSSLSAALSVTCNATIPSAYAVTARTAGASFTLTTTANVANPGCFSYHIVN